MPSNNSNQGHRRRLRERFLKSGLSGFQDYEIIELLLTMGTPRRDCKQPAKEALKRFKTVRGVLEASPEELQQIEGIGSQNTICFSLLREVAERLLKEKIIDKPIFSSAQQIFDYLYLSMRGLKKEVFRVLFLNNQLQIIEIEDLFKGTVSSSQAPLRTVFENALKHSAASLVFVHNHPSGNPIPSLQDKEQTRELVFGGAVMCIRVLDHIIIGGDKYFSFAAEGLIGQYETDFLNLKVKGASEARRQLYRAKLFSEPD
mgnify:CR=1 FL=1